MQRRKMLAALVVAIAPVRVTPSSSATVSEQERRTDVLDTLKKAIIDATPYAGKDLELKYQSNQFFVTIINSGLNKSAPIQRETEASKIVSTITRVVADNPDYKGILGVHIDYVARSADGSRTDPVDGIDFRKDPAGRFVHHTT